MKKVCIFGAGSFAREILATVERSGFEVECFIAETQGMQSGLPIKTIEYFSPAKHKAVIAVGNPYLKEKIVKQLTSISNNIDYPNIIDPKAVLLSPKTILFNKGNVIMANAVLTVDIKINNFNHIYSCCTITHDDKIGDFNQFSPGVNISGKNIIQNLIYFGANSGTLEKLYICSDVIIGAGGVITKDITEPGTYVGVPVKRIK